MPEMESVPLLSTAIEVSCFSDNTEKSLAYRQIEDDIGALTRSILALKKRHNSLNITARLPDEILAYVFVWGLEIRLKDVRKQVIKRYRKYPPWIRVAAVCTSWRRVALACPQLWSIILNRKCKWLTRIIIPRSRDTPLEVILPLVERASWTGFRAVLDEIRRIRKLHFEDHFVAPVRIDNLLAGLTRPAPILEYFKASTGSRSNVHSLPDNLFDNIAPKLRTLKLISCTIPSSSPLVHQLTTLVLKDLNRNDGPSFFELMDLLRSALMVEILKLKHPCRFELDDLQPSSMSPILLSRLTRLVIEDETAECAKLLSSIYHPASTYLDISDSTNGYFSNDIVALCGLANELSTGIDSIIHIELSHSYGIYKITAQAVRQTEDLSFQMYIRFSNNNPNAFPAFLHHTRFINLTSLRLEGKELSKDAWLDLFGDLLLLRDIHVDGSAGPGLLDALTAGISLGEMLRAILWLTQNSAKVAPDSEASESLDVETLQTEDGNLWAKVRPTSEAFEGSSSSDQVWETVWQDVCDVVGALKNSYGKHESSAHEGNTTHESPYRGDPEWNFLTEFQRLNAMSSAFDEEDATLADSESTFPMSGGDVSEGSSESKEAERLSAISSALKESNEISAARLAELQLPFAKGVLRLTSLERLEIENWHSPMPGLAMDTVILAAVLLARHGRQATLRCLSVTKSTHFTPAYGDRGIKKLRQLLETVEWDVIDGVNRIPVPEPPRRRRRRTFQTRRDSDTPVSSPGLRASSVPDESTNDGFETPDEHDLEN